MKSRIVVVCVTLLFLASWTPAAFAQCKVNEPGMHTYFQSDLNKDLDDYGRILMDADNSSCAQNALYALYDKITDTLQYPNGYQQWLDGYKISLAFAAAERIGANGWASKDLDDKLQAIEGRFLVVSVKPTDPPTVCGNDNLGTCMDSDTGAAAAYGWMAAYEYHRGRNAVSSSQASQAVTYLHKSLSPDDVCIHDPYAAPSSVLCNGTVAQLREGQNHTEHPDAVTMGVNHGGEAIAYGFGLMTGVSTAILGLDQSGGPYFPWSADEATIARGLFEEAERHVDDYGNFKHDCASPVRQGNGIWAITFDRDCGDPPFNYTPDMYTLYRFYTDTGIGVPSVTGTSYRSLYPGGNFRLGPYDPEGSGCSSFCFSFGRYSFYQLLSSDWRVNRRDYMPFDNFDPIGYFDSISPSGLAQGWSCDNDKPTGRVVVDIYDDYGNKVQGFADQSSEQEVNQRCWGGTAHRFYIQLPSYMAGSNIHAYGLDYTWYGYTELACNQYPRCSF
jgi:hypothetical protein